MGPKVTGVPTLGILGFPFGSRGTKWHLGGGSVVKYIIYYNEEGDGFPQVRAGMSLMSLCLPVVHLCTKCSNYTLTSLLFGLCMSMWVIEFFFNLPSLILKLQHAPLPSKCCTQERAPTPYPFSVFTFRLAVDSIKELGGASLNVKTMRCWRKDKFSTWWNLVPNVVHIIIQVNRHYSQSYRGVKF
jgi:hypothetical protein